MERHVPVRRNANVKVRLHANQGGISCQVLVRLQTIGLQPSEPVSPKPIMVCLILMLRGRAFVVFTKLVW